MFEVYRGTERNSLIKRLVPGVRYSVRVKVCSCILFFLTFSLLFLFLVPLCL